MYYYRIYDDLEEMNYFKSSFDDKKIKEHLLEFEKERKQYCNPDFVEFLKKRDVDAETIEVHNLSYQQKNDTTIYFGCIHSQTLFGNI